MKLTLGKPQPVPTFKALPPAPAPRAALYDHYAGIAELRESPWGTCGCVLQPGTVIVQTYKTDLFRVAFRLGDLWVEHPSGVRPDDPGILELLSRGRLTSYGEAPAVKAKREAREAERLREAALANPPGPRRLRVGR